MMQCTGLHLMSTFLPAKYIAELEEKDNTMDTVDAVDSTDTTNAGDMLSITNNNNSNTSIATMSQPCSELSPFLSSCSTAKLPSPTSNQFGYKHPLAQST